MPLARPINHAHSTASDLLQNFVVADPGSRATLAALRRGFDHARDRIRQAVEIHVLTTNGHPSSPRLRRGRPMDTKFWPLGLRRHVAALKALTCQRTPCPGSGFFLF